LPRPLIYDADLSLPAAESNAFRIQSPREVFDLHGHPKAKRAYGWYHLDGKNDEEERFVTVLEIPPVESALTAVRVASSEKFAIPMPPCQPAEYH
jgi:hypothetical protein